jgi:flagellar FliL protein
MAANTKAAESDAEIEGDEEKAKAPKKWLSLKMMIIAGAGVAVIGGGAFAALTMFKPHHKEEPPAAPVVKPVVFVDMPDVLVNLSNTNADRPQYLKIKIVFEVADQNMAQQITPLMPRIMDTFQTYLRELRPSDLDGSVGLFRLREELTRRVNAALAPGRINAVLFKEIVIQ